MLIEIIQPAGFLLCLLSLYGVFHTAFLAPAADWSDRLLASVEMLALSAAISLVSGLIFCDHRSTSAGSRPALRSTLPMQLFFWAAGLMVVLFLASWYLETHCIFYRDTRRL